MGMSAQHCGTTLRRLCWPDIRPRLLLVLLLALTISEPDAKVHPAEKSISSDGNGKVQPLHIQQSQEAVKQPGGDVKQLTNAEKLRARYAARAARVAAARARFRERKRGLDLARKRRMKRRGRRDKTTRPTASPPPTVAIPPRSPGDALDILRSCDTCQLILAWADLTKFKNPAEFTCLQVGRPKRTIDHTQLGHCIANLCSDLLGKSILLLTRCQNFAHNNRRLLSYLNMPGGMLDWRNMTLQAGRKSMRYLCEQGGMCPVHGSVLGMHKAKETSTMLLPLNCRGFMRILEVFQARLFEQPGTGVFAMLRDANIPNLDYRFQTCHCRFADLLAVCVHVFHGPEQAALRYRCLDLVQYDAKQGQSYMCEALCDKTKSLQSVALHYGHCVQTIPNHPSV